MEMNKEEVYTKVFVLFSAKLVLYSARHKIRGFQHLVSQSVLSPQYSTLAHHSIFYISSISCHTCSDDTAIKFNFGIGAKSLEFTRQPE